MDPRGTVGRIHKEDNYTLLHTKYESSGSCGFEEEDFFYVFPIICLWELMTPRDGAIFDPRGMVGRIYKEDHEEDFFGFANDALGAAPVWTLGGTVGRIYREDYYTMLHTKYEGSGPCGFGEDFFMFFLLFVFGIYLLPWKPEF